MLQSTKKCIHINAILLKFQFISPEKKNPQKKYETSIIILNVYWAANQHIRMISEESCDTEINYILKYIIIKKQLF